MERGNLIAYKGSEEHKPLNETTIWLNKGNGSLIIEHPDGYNADFYDIDGSLKFDESKKYLLVLDRQVEPLNQVVELPAIEVEEEEELNIIQVEQPITVKHRKSNFPNPDLASIGKIEKPKKEEEKSIEIVNSAKNKEIVNDSNVKNEIERREAEMKELAEEAIASNVFVFNEQTDVYHILGKTEYDMTGRDRLAQFLGNTPEYAEFTKDLLNEQKKLQTKLASVDGISNKIAEQLSLTYVTPGKLKDALKNGDLNTTKKVKALLAEIL